jgi:hypothetical protein
VAASGNESKTAWKLLLPTTTVKIDMDVDFYRRTFNKKQTRVT